MFKANESECGVGMVLVMEVASGYVNVEREEGGDGYVGKKDDEVRVTIHFGPHAHGKMVEVS